MSWLVTFSLSLFTSENKLETYYSIITRLWSRTFFVIKKIIQFGAINCSKNNTFDRVYYLTWNGFDRNLPLLFCGENKLYKMRREE